MTGAAPGSAAEREAEAGSSSCHVFMAEPITSQVRAESHHCGVGNTDLILITQYLQSEREIRARTFQFELSEAGAGGQGVQFPANADPVLNVIYKLRGLSPAQEAAPLPPPPPEAARSSPTSSAASNSDSGIGYRDEAPHPQVGN